MVHPLRSIILALAVILLLGGSASALDWPMFCQNAQHTGTADSPTPDRPMILWQKHLNDKGFYATPAVADGRVFIGGLDRKMYALDAETGDTVWTFSTTQQQNGHGIDDTAAVFGGKVYFGSDDFVFYCVDEEKGTLIWSFNLASQTGANPQTYGFQASPLVANGVVYAGADMSNADITGLVDNLQVFDANTGAVRWTFDTNGRVYPSPALYGNRLFVGTIEGKFYVIDITSAGPNKQPRILWSKTYDHGLMGSPTIIDDRVYVPLGEYRETEDVYYLYAYDMNGNEVWKFKTSWPILSTPIPWEENLYFADYGGTVHAVNIQGGAGGTTEEVWKHRLSDEKIWATPLLSDGKLFIASEDQRLYALDPRGNGDGTTFELWNLTLDGPIWTSPVAVDGKLYIATTFGTVYCIVQDTNPPGPPEPVLDSVSIEPQEAKAGGDITIYLAFKDGGDLDAIKEVFVDLSAVGGLSKEYLQDDGTDGDKVAHDGIYSKRFTLPKVTPVGYYDIIPTAVTLGGKKMSESVTFYVGAADTGGGDNGDIPGFSPVALILALCIALFVLRRRKEK